ncbi:hypothetical protein BC350_12180 [Ralstonia pseudosolanacearum]|nr:hypothetical protein BC350_12180 [Ralstonia pseudosolanacearum]
MSRGLYQLAKYVYGLKGVNFEDQLEELVEKDLDYQMRQKWFLNATSGKEGQYFEKLKRTVSDAEGFSPPNELGGSESNDVNSSEIE